MDEDTVGLILFMALLTLVVFIGRGCILAGWTHDEEMKRIELQCPKPAPSRAAGKERGQ